MPTVAERPSNPKPNGKAASKTAKVKLEYAHPDDYRMTLGDHLEELRMRLFFGLIGYVLVAIGCFIFGEKVVWYFCRPLAYALESNKLSPQVFVTAASETFMVYVKISMITAAVFASPWMLYQLWQFVAAGLYPKERKYVTKYLPLSVVLLISGMLFLYFFVLPITLKFFIGFNIGPAIPMTAPAQIDPIAVNRLPVRVPTLQGDPANPVDGEIWLDVVQHRLKLRFDGETRVVQFGSDQLVTPIITLAWYIDMVIDMLIGFGLAFQMPLVVLLLVRIGIVDVPTLRKFRKYAYFIITIVAAVIVPDVVGGMIALMIPLIGLYEMGIWMAARPVKEDPDALAT
jgi:sec-independent protein translocase protein TatC